MVLFPQISDIVLTHTKYQIWFSQISDFVFPDIRFCFPRYQILFSQISDLVFPDIRFGFSIYQILIFQISDSFLIFFYKIQFLKI